MITGTCRGSVKPQVAAATLEYLRRNQDQILEGQKKLTVKGVQGVAPPKDLWTKWHQSELLQTAELKKDLTRMPNARYMAVSPLDGCDLPISLRFASQVSI